MSLQKTKSNAINQVKTTVDIAISNNLNFCCTTADLSYLNESELVAPSFDDTTQWFSELFKKVMVYKPLPQVALDNMAKKGITPKKQAGELLVFVVVPSENHLHIGVNVPKDCKFDEDTFKKDVLGEYGFSKNDNLYSFEHESPFKERDNLVRKVFCFLKKTGLYVEDEDSDDEMYSFD